MKKIFLTFLACAFVTSPTFADNLSEEKELAQQYLLKMAQEPQSVVTEDGIVIRPLVESGSQKFAPADSVITVHYHLSDREGKAVDESFSSDETPEFPLNKLIKCWQKAVPQISLGSMYKISCPSSMAYGDKGIDGAIKGGAALTFRMIVFSFKSAP